MLYIKVENGQTVDHPVFSDNLIQVFGEIPTNYEPFNRTVKPFLKHFEVDDVDAVQYAKVNGVWTDLWPTRPMYAAERAVEEQRLREHIENGRVNSIINAKEYLSRVQDQDARDALQAYIDALEVFVPVDLVTPNWPDPPLIVNGKLRNNNVSAPGTAPTVIG